MRWTPTENGQFRNRFFHAFRTLRTVGIMKTDLVRKFLQV